MSEWETKTIGADKARTSRKAGRLVVMYARDSERRRLLIGEAAGGVLAAPLLLATTKAEARSAIAALTDLAGELPE